MAIACLKKIICRKIARYFQNRSILKIFIF
jgi:hypothetical protein